MKTIIIVEGKSDTRRLKEVYSDIITFETSGLGLDEKKIKKLQEFSLDTKLIVFTDPDGPGEKIRARLTKEIDNLFHAYLPNEKALSKNQKKIGVEHASSEDIREALENLYSQSKQKMTYIVGDLIDWNIYSSKNRRIMFCDKLHIAYGNNRKVVDQLNIFGIKYEQIKEVLEEIDGRN